MSHGASCCTTARTSAPSSARKRVRIGAGSPRALCAPRCKVHRTVRRPIRRHPAGARHDAEASGADAGRAGDRRGTPAQPDRGDGVHVQSGDARVLRLDPVPADLEALRLGERIRVRPCLVRGARWNDARPRGYPLRGSPAGRLRVAGAQPNCRVLPALEPLPQQLWPAYRASDFRPIACRHAVAVPERGSLDGLPTRGGRLAERATGLQGVRPIAGSATDCMRNTSVPARIATDRLRYATGLTRMSHCQRLRVAHAALPPDSNSDRASSDIPVLAHVGLPHDCAVTAAACPEVGGAHRAGTTSAGHDMARRLSLILLSPCDLQMRQVC